MDLSKIDKWLPTSVKELRQSGKNGVDVVLFSGDAYIDHPSFGTAVIGRVMEAEGLTVAVVPKPNWQDDLRDFKKFGRPEMFFAVTAGNMDSMVNHYTAAKRKRSDDAYTPGGRPGQRPDRATITYCQILKRMYPEIPLIVGGIEASMRRFTHYDYWADELRPSILVDSKADLLFYGMGEKSVLAFARLLKKGVPVNKLTNIPQTAFLVAPEAHYPTRKSWKELELASHEACLADKWQFARNFKYIEEASNKVDAEKLIQKTGGKNVVVNPPWPVPGEEETDRIYDLPYTRLPHPRYQGKAPIPAWEMIRHSVNLHRGCFGGCAFCTI